MKSGKIFAGITMALINVALCTVAVGQDHATAQEVVAKVREAASTLSKTGDLAQFNQRSGPWVWKDTYIFIHDCSKKVTAAHPIKPEMIGQDISSIKDAKSGKSIYPRLSRLLQDGSGFAFRRVERVLVAEARREGALPQGCILLTRATRTLNVVRGRWRYVPQKDCFELTDVNSHLKSCGA
jgi:hypothetical protein